MEIKCPTCGLERTVDAASAEHAEEQTCDPCAASYKALLAEIEVRAAQRTADAAMDAHLEAPAPLSLTAPANDGDSEAQSLSPEAGARDEQEELDSDGYALGVSLYRMPATALAVSAVCLFAALFFAGWLRPADAAQSASVVAPVAVTESAVAESTGVQEDEDKVVDDSTSSPTEAVLPPAAEVKDDEPVAAVEVAADEASAEEIDEAQFEKEELAAEAGDEPEAAPVPAPAPAKSAAEEGKFTVQVGSHNQRPRPNRGRPYCAPPASTRAWPRSKSPGKGRGIACSRAASRRANRPPSTRRVCARRAPPRPPSSPSQRIDVSSFAGA